MFLKTAKMASFEKIVMQPRDLIPIADLVEKKKPKKIINKGRRPRKRLSGGSRRKRTRKCRRNKKNSINDKLLEILIDLL